VSLTRNAPRIAVLTMIGLALLVGWLARPAPAKALFFDCYYVPNPPYDCKFGTLPANNASGWTGPRNFYAHRALSNINTQYTKGLAVYYDKLYGWWYGGNGSMLFERINNNGNYFWGYKAICKNHDGTRSQIMLCQTVRD
jgi:hypothetical protein